MSYEEIKAIIEKEFPEYEIIIGGESVFSYNINLKLNGYEIPNIKFSYHNYDMLIGFTAESNHISIKVNTKEIIKIYEYQMVEHIRLYKPEIDKYAYALIQIESNEIFENIKYLELNKDSLIKRMIREEKLNNII